MSIIFIGTPEFAVPSLRRLAEEGHEISAVITQPDRPAGRGRHMRTSPVKGAALELGLMILQPTSLRDEAVLERLRGIQPEVMAAVAYGQILRPEVLSIAPKGIVNVHPSLLPRYRGASPIQSALLAGDHVTGVTIMLMDAGMDSGPILAQEETAVLAEDTGGSLSARLAEMGARLLAGTLRSWLDGGIKPRPQDDVEATITRLLKKEDGVIDWTQSAAQISRQVRAFNPWPGSFTRLAGEKVKIWKALPAAGGDASNPGEVVALTDDRTEIGMAVTTGDGVLTLVEVQREGRKRVSAADFARGVRGVIGSQLG